MKRLLSTFLFVAAGVAGSVVASYLYSRWTSELSASSKYLALLIAAISFMVILAVLLESRWAIAWNWRWHRHWYFRSLVKDNELRQCADYYARLRFSEHFEKVPEAEVIYKGARQDALDILERLIIPAQTRFNRILFLGQPGSGKTTVLQRLTFEIAAKGLQRLGIGQPIPVFVRLGGFQTGRLIDYIREEMHDTTQGRSGTVLGNGIEILLRNGRAVLLLDALDEVLGDQRTKAISEIRRFLTSRHYLKTPVVITSRTQQDPSAALDKVLVFEMQDLSNKAVDAFIRSYKSPGASVKAIRNTMEAHGLLDREALGRNPFWLRLILDSGFTHTKNKGHILNNAIDTLFTREWDSKLDAERSWKKALPKEEQLTVTKRGIAHLAYQMSMHNKVTVRESAAVTILGNWKNEMGGLEGLRAQDVLGFCRDAQVLVYQPGPVRFRHKLLQEHMTAFAINQERRLLFTQDLIECRLNNPEWSQTLIFLWDLIPENDENTRETLFQHTLGDSGDAQRILLAVTFIANQPHADQGRVEQILQALAQSLHQQLTIDHYKVASCLASLADKQLLATLDRLAHDTESTIKARAAILLGEIKSKDSAVVLANCLSDSSIFHEVSASLKSIGYTAVEPLIDALEDDSREAAFRAIDILVELGAPAVESLVDALSNGSKDVSGLAVDALGRIGSPAVLPLIDVLRDWNNRRWRLAVDALGMIGAPAVQPLIDMLSDTEFADLAVKALAKIGEPAVPPLIDELGHINSLVSNLVLVTLVEIGPSAIPYLIDVWNKRSWDLSVDPRVYDLVGAAIYGIEPNHILLKERPMADRNINPNLSVLIQNLASARKLLNKKW